jgi:hypothetical protein
MKKLLVIVLVAITATNAQAQKYLTRTGKIYFNATAKNSPEKIEAVNNEVAAILNGASGEFIFQVPIKSFKFERELMEQHYNENYMESSKFPKSEFRGKIANPSAVDYSKDGTYNVTVSGELNMHGVANAVSAPGTVTVKGKDATAKAKFTVKLADYKIVVPAIAAEKVGKEAVITVDALMNQK